MRDLEQPGAYGGRTTVDVVRQRRASHRQACLDVVIPHFDADNPDHVRLAQLREPQADIVANLDLDVRGNFVTLRRRVRQTLEGTAAAAEIASLVEDMLG